MVSENLAHIEKRIQAALRRAGREPAGVEIVAVTKGRSVDAIRECIDAGLTAVGESRVQEAKEKIRFFRPLSSAYTCAASRQIGLRADLYPVQWHLIGHVQTNKAKQAVEMFDLIHSVDSARCAAVIDKEAARQNKIQNILLEIKTSGETTKYGIFPDDAVHVHREIALLKHVRVLGLMTVAGLVPHAEDARPFFRALKLVFDTINRGAREPLTVLSMGMSDDFEVAVEEGATMVRIGRALFD